MFKRLIAAIIMIIMTPIWLALGFTIAEVFDNLGAYLVCTLISIWLIIGTYDWLVRILNIESKEKSITSFSQNMELQEKFDKEEKIKQQLKVEAEKQRKKEEETNQKRAAIISEIIKGQKAIKMLVRDNYSTSPCNNCNDKYYKYLTTNSVGSGIHVQCISCGNKKWIHIAIEKKSNLILSVVKKLKSLRKSLDEFVIMLGDYSYGVKLKIDGKIKTITYEHETITGEFKLFKFEENTDSDLIKNKRKSIPKSVQREVWKRDEAKCVECGSKLNLEYDHIIPVSKGGANTVRYIQLLCEKHNRSKSNKIG